MRVRSLHVYPVKSCRGLDVGLDAPWPLDGWGLRHDRRFMIVRPEGGFVTQRERPALARIATTLEGDALVLSAEGRRALRLPLEDAGASMEVQVWRDRVRARRCGEAADAWLAAVLDEPVHLVRFPADERRAVDPRFGDGHATAFADGFPVLIVSQASLDDLNARLAAPVPMDRFRPNLVVDGATPFAEDGWGEVRVGAATIRIAKPCARCVVTTTDQRTGERSPEPLRTLATYRRDGQNVLFAQNAVVTRPGLVRIGDEVVPA